MTLNKIQAVQESRDAGVVMMEQGKDLEPATDSNGWCLTQRPG